MNNLKSKNVIASEAILMPAKALFLKITSPVIRGKLYLLSSR